MALIEGKARSGGSRKNWETYITGGSVVEVELPLSAANRVICDPSPFATAKIIEPANSEPAAVEKVSESPDNEQLPPSS